MSLIQTIHLTMGNYKSPMVVPAVQNDTDRQLKMIVDDFTLSNSMTGKMTFKRPDGTFYEADATLALADNAFVAELDQALTCPGRTLAQLKVTATDTVSTFTFIVWVEADTSGTLTPQEGISLSEAVQRAEDAADRAEAAAESGAGLTDNVKQALLQIARKVAYIDAHGQDYYDDLYDALYEVTGLTLDVTSIALGTIGATSQITATTVPSGATVTWASSDTSVATVANGLITAVGYGSATITASAGNLTAQCSVVIAQATVTSISAVYTPSATIYETAIPALDTLKNDLVVTATWSNGTTSTVSDYALSGTLSAGSNTITVSYGGQTTTITVTVVALSSISAVYTQSGTVYTTTSLDDLKTDLVVTANFADSTTQTVTGYTLSGTLTEGTSTITVGYAGKTATFTVTVTHATVYYTITNSLTDVTNSNSATSIAELTAYSGTLTAASGYIMSTVTVMMGDADITSTAYDSATGAISIASVTGNIAITAVAVEDVGWISGVAYDVATGAVRGDGMNTKTGAFVENASGDYYASDYLPCYGVSAVVTWANNVFVYFYDADKNYIGYLPDRAFDGLTRPTPINVPRHAHFLRVDTRIYTGTTPASMVITPYKYADLTEDTTFSYGEYYNLTFTGADNANIKSNKGLVYGAKYLQTSMYSRSWIYFYDAEKTQLSYVTRQSSLAKVAIPDGTYYIEFEPNAALQNNPWVILYAE